MERPTYAGYLHSPHFDQIDAFLTAFHGGGSDARERGLALIEGTPRVGGAQLADALPIARAVAVHLDGGPPERADDVLREATGLG